MINKDRIVPVTKTDLISLYAFIIKHAHNSYNLQVLESVGVGEFVVSGETAQYIASEPVKKLDFADVPESGQGDLYFVPAYDFEGITFNGEAIEYGSNWDEIEPDGASLYYASYDSTGVTFLIKHSF